MSCAGRGSPGLSTGKSLLPPSLVNHHGNGIGQVEAAITGT